MSDIDDFDDSDEAALRDIQFFDLMNAAGLIPELPDAKARVLRLEKRLKLRVMESPMNRERVYFRQEYVNGFFDE